MSNKIKKIVSILNENKKRKKNEKVFKVFGGLGRDSLDDSIEYYKRKHSTTLLGILRLYNDWEKGKNEWNEKKKWKRGEAQLRETKAVESILTKRGIKFEKIVGKRK